MGKREFKRYCKTREIPLRQPRKLTLRFDVEIEMAITEEYIPHEHKPGIRDDTNPVHFMFDRTDEAAKVCGKTKGEITATLTVNGETEKQYVEFVDFEAKDKAIDSYAEQISYYLSKHLPKELCRTGAAIYDEAVSRIYIRNRHTCDTLNQTGTYRTRLINKHRSETVSAARKRLRSNPGRPLPRSESVEREKEEFVEKAISCLRMLKADGEKLSKASLARKMEVGSEKKESTRTAHMNGKLKQYGVSIEELLALAGEKN